MIDAAVKVMRIATGEETEEINPAWRRAASELGARGGKGAGRKDVTGAARRDSPARREGAMA